STTSSAAQTNRGHRGLMVFISITVAGGSGSVTLTIEGYDPVSTNWVILNGGAAALTGAATTGIELSPGASGATVASSNIIQRIGGGLPRTWRVNVVPSGGASWTYSVGYQLLR